MRNMTTVQQFEVKSDKFNEIKGSFSTSALVALHDSPNRWLQWECFHSVALHKLKRHKRVSRLSALPVVRYNLTRHD